MPFSDDSQKFLLENRINDSKLWFEEHRAEYEAFVLTPLRELVEDIRPAMAEIDPGLICEPKVGRSISRIFRDTRFSKDKSLFRDVMWCVFLRTKQENVPGFWFEIQPAGVRWGCGWYSTPPEVMEAIRALILENDAAAKRAMAAYKRQSVYTLEDERFKRARFPEESEERRLWLEQRSICFTAHSRDPEFIFSPNLARELGESFAILKPEYDFLMKAQSRAPKNGR